jgi:hypothetical protein
MPQAQEVPLVLLFAPMPAFGLNPADRRLTLANVVAVEPSDRVDVRAHGCEANGRRQRLVMPQAQDFQLVLKHPHFFEI